MPDLDISAIAPLYDQWADSWWGGERDESYGLIFAPLLVGEGTLPETISTCRELVGPPTWCWDTNGWYELLGISWPYVDATVGQISKSYIAHGGQQDPRMTYVFKKLLDKRVRRSYHSVPLGSLYLDDEAVQRMLKDQARREAEKRGAQVDIEEVFKDWGLDVVQEGDTSDTVSEHTESDVEDLSSSESLPVAYWVHQAFGRGQEDHERVLGQWIEALLREAGKVHYVGNLCVGVHGITTLPDAYLDSTHTVPIAYLNESLDGDLGDLAALIIAQLTSLTQGETP